MLFRSIESKSSLLLELSKKYNLDSLDIDILEKYLTLIPEHRKAMKDFILDVANSAMNNKENTATVDNVLEGKQNTPYDKEDPIEKELNSYRLELEAEKKGQISSVSEDIEESYKEREAK